MSSKSVDGCARADGKPHDGALTAIERSFRCSHTTSFFLYLWESSRSTSPTDFQAGGMKLEWVEGAEGDYGLDEAAFYEGAPPAAPPPRKHVSFSLRLDLDDNNDLLELCKHISRINIDTLNIKIGNNNLNTYSMRSRIWCPYYAVNSHVFFAAKTLLAG
ncbi:hypothetical protein EVAR_96421_1 [Eumeta japonica]|uniref:Uncharacterized protein n=1 Tax=Eumeta variegata TaxID=151549 RepID=A0A4C1WD32_EUMVA|nr:hypothetical protein EVAR_96421_1 [Eumeta japonica]